MENKYYGIKQAELMDKSLPSALTKRRRQKSAAILLPAKTDAETEWRRNKKSHPFFISLLICSLFIGAYILLGLIENPAIEKILNNVYRILTFDLLGTDPSACVINSWLASIL